MEKKPLKERLFPPLPPVEKTNGKESVQNEDNKMLTDNFDSGSEWELDIICNVNFVLSIE